MTEKDSEKPKTSKRKWWADKGLSWLSHFMKFYVIAIPMFYAIILLWLIDSLSKIPDFESPLLSPTLKIGLYLVIIASVVGIFSQLSIELRFRKMESQLNGINRDLYEKKSNNTLQKIPKTPKETPTFWDYFPFSWIKDFMNWLPEREIVTKERTTGYLLLILAAVVVIQILGTNLAENTAPHAKSFDYSSINDPNFKLKNIVINYNITNIDNTRFDLMRSTERLHVKFSIINHNSTELLIKYNERSFVGNSFIENLSIDDKKVPANETLEFSRLLYLKDEGINTFYFDFTIHNATFTKYGFLSDDSFVGKETLQRSFRVYSSEDYNSRTNQYWVYYFLGPIALPLILLGARAFKEIIEDKSKEKKP